MEENIIMKTKDRLFYDSNYDDEFSSTCELLEYILENNLEIIAIVEDLIDEFEIELEDWIELYNQFKENCGFDYCEIEKAKKLIGKMKTCEIL